MDAPFSLTYAHSKASKDGTQSTDTSWGKPDLVSITDLKEPWYNVEEGGVQTVGSGYSRVNLTTENKRIDEIDA